MARLAWVCLGGAVGSGARFLLAEWLGSRGGGVFPWPILAVNLLGCLAAGFLGACWALRSPAPEVVALAVTGFLGGFTTYSAFNHGVFVLYAGGRAWLAAGYVAATVVGGLVAGLLGAGLGRWVR
ncbi:MAG: CrcB family protein [Planctomycetia bacterium]|nr:CrcB family protein [Planctomycetia bacterium]